MASWLLAEPPIAAAVEEAKAKRSARVEVKQDDVLRETLRLAMSDLRKAFDKSGNLLPVNEWPDDVASFISSIEVDELWSRGRGRVQIGNVKKIRLWSKTSALELLAKHLGMLVDRHEHSGPGGKSLFADMPTTELIEKAQEAIEVLAKAGKK